LVEIQRIPNEKNIISSIIALGVEMNTCYNVDCPKNNYLSNSTCFQELTDICKEVRLGEWYLNWAAVKKHCISQQENRLNWRVGCMCEYRNNDAGISHSLCLLHKEKLTFDGYLEPAPRPDEKAWQPPINCYTKNICQSPAEFKEMREKLEAEEYEKEKATLRNLEEEQKIRESLKACPGCGNHPELVSEELMHSSFSNLSDGGDDRIEISPGGVICPHCGFGASTVKAWNHRRDDDEILSLS
jgi:hypothetical protein